MSDPYAKPYNDPGQGAADSGPSGPPGPSALTGQWSAPGTGYPGYPQSGYAQPGYPQPGYAQPGYPQPGYAQPGYGYYPGMAPAPVTSGLTVAALIVGIASVLISVIPFLGLVSFLLGPLAIALGVVSLAKRLHRRGFAIAGVVTGAFALLVCILYSLLLPTLLMMASPATNTYGFEVYSDGDFQTSVITTNLLAPEFEMHSGDYVASMEASPLLGSVIATNAAGNSGQLTCVIYDEDGYILVEDHDLGTDAQVECHLTDAWDSELDEESADLEATETYLR